MESPSSVPTTQWATAHAVPVRWMQQFRYFSFLYDKIRHLPGDVVECGVGEGNTIVMLAYLMGSESRQPPRSLWDLIPLRVLTNIESSALTTRHTVARRNGQDAVKL